MSDTIEAVKEFLSDIEGYKEVAELVIPEIDAYLTRASDGLCKLRMRQIDTFKKAGYTREEAILLTLDVKLALKNAMSDYKSK